MKAWKALIEVLLVPLALTALVDCGPGRYVAKPNEELYGTWQNEVMGVKKVAIAADGYRIYSLATDAEPVSAGTLEITAKWTDSKGTLWYKVYQTVTAGTGGFKGAKSQVLYQVGKSGTVLEMIDTPVSEFDPSAFPTKLDPKSSSYGLYYRTAERSPRRVLIGDMWTEASQEHTR